MCVTSRLETLRISTTFNFLGVAVILRLGDEDQSTPFQAQDPDPNLLKHSRGKKMYALA